MAVFAFCVMAVCVLQLHNTYGQIARAAEEYMEQLTHAHTNLIKYLRLIAGGLVHLFFFKQRKVEVGPFHKSLKLLMHSWISGPTVM